MTKPKKRKVGRPIDPNKTPKTAFTLKLEDDVRAELEQIKAVTGKDLTAQIHEALDWYKDSPQFKAELRKLQIDLEKKKAAIARLGKNGN